MGGLLQTVMGGKKVMEYSYRDELMHYGIKGQKWGVRRYQNEDGSLKGAGKKRYSRFFSDKDTYERIKSIKNTKRMDHMSKKQKESLDKAEAYWKARANGETPTEKRNIIKRQADRYRSYSLKARTGQAVAIGVISNLGTQKIRSDTFGKSAAIGQTASAAVKTATANIALSELENKIFGHF